MESAIEAHDREHQLLERLWTQRLIAIEDRLANIEEALQGWRGAPLPNARLSKRDVGRGRRQRRARHHPLAHPRAAGRAGGARRLATHAAPAL